MTEEKISVFTKKKTVQTLIDYCLENKLEFSIIPKSNDDFEVVFNIENYKSAVALGMCLKELKLELTGMPNAYASVANLKNTKKIVSNTENIIAPASAKSILKTESKVTTEDIFGSGLPFDLDEVKN